jgi:hypothetical protein
MDGSGKRGIGPFFVELRGLPAGCIHGEVLIVVSVVYLYIEGRC